MKNVLLLLAILIASALPAAAQSAADGLDTTLVAYYRWCNRHKQDPEMLLKADTMFRLAGERQNPRMQSVALCLKTDYYYYTGNLDSLKVWVARTQQFTREHDQLTHYYFIWTRLITYYSKYTLAQYELERFRDPKFTATTTSPRSPKPTNSWGTFTAPNPSMTRPSNPTPKASGWSSGTT